MDYTLYKEPISLDTLNIVQYLHAHGIKIIPKYIIERNHGVLLLPSIRCNDELYSGLNQVINFYETVSGIDDLLDKSIKWKEQFPNYKINP